MDSPVRKMLKKNDYNRHKLLRKIKRRNKAAAEKDQHAAEKALKKKLRVTPPKYDDGKLTIKEYANTEDVHVNPDGSITTRSGNTGDVILPEVTIRPLHLEYKTVDKVNGDDLADVALSLLGLNSKYQYGPESPMNMHGLETVSPEFDALMLGRALKQPSTSNIDLLDENYILPTEFTNDAHTIKLNNIESAINNTDGIIFNPKTNKFSYSKNIPENAITVEGYRPKWEKVSMADALMSKYTSKWKLPPFIRDKYVDLLDKHYTKGLSVKEQNQLRMYERSLDKYYSKETVPSGHLLKDILSMRNLFNSDLYLRRLLDRGFTKELIAELVEEQNNLADKITVKWNPFLDPFVGGNAYPNGLINIAKPVPNPRNNVLFLEDLAEGHNILRHEIGHTIDGRAFRRSIGTNRWGNDIYTYRYPNGIESSLNIALINANDFPMEYIGSKRISGMNDAASYYLNPTEIRTRFLGALDYMNENGIKTAEDFFQLDPYNMPNGVRFNDAYDFRTLYEPKKATQYLKAAMSMIPGVYVYNNSNR